jgi:hypothetical protein
MGRDVRVGGSMKRHAFSTVSMSLRLLMVSLHFSPEYRLVRPNLELVVQVGATPGLQVRGWHHPRL